MIEANKYKLGIFVTVAVTLILGSFFLIGMSELFAPKMEAMTVFKDSVEGLKTGSPVKYKGVTLGRVTRIAMRDIDEYVDVFMIVSSSSMDTVLADQNDIVPSSSSNFNDYLMKLKTRGIRCSLQSAGITGGAYLELDTEYNNAPILDVKVDKDYLYIPSRPSHVAEFIGNLSSLAENISKIDFVTLKNKLERVLDTVDGKLNSDKFEQIVSKLDTLIGQLEITTANVNGALDAKKLNKISDNLDSTLESIKTLSQTLNGSVDQQKLKKFADDLDSAIKSVKNLAQKAEQRMDDLDGFRTKVNTTIAKFNQTLDSLTELMNYVNDDPSSIVRGKNKPPVVK